MFAYKYPLFFSFQISVRLEQIQVPINGDFSAD